ncbi:MAG: hypothetical protein ACC641_07525 [Acidiferrobacterales bacterium]
MSDSREQANEELRLLYQTSVTELEFFKRQQWSVTNYGLLLYAAIVSLARLFDSGMSSAERWVLCLVATATGFASIYILKVLNNSIDVRKARLGVIREQFGPEFHHAWNSRIKEEETLSIYRLLLMIMVFGAGAVWWLVIFKI